MKHTRTTSIILTLLSLFLLASCSQKARDPSFFIDENGNVIVEYANGKQQTIGNVRPNGNETPKSITNAELNAGGELILTFSDGSTLNLGTVKDPNPGSPEETGTDVPGPGTVSITGAQIVNDSLVLTFSNGHSVTVGKLEGSEGKKIQSISVSNGVWSIRYTDGTVFPPEPSTSTDEADPPTEEIFRQSGRAVSNVSKTLTLWANWEAASYDGKNAVVTVKVGLTCYSIEVGKRAGESAGTVTVNDETRHFDTPAISHSINQEKHFRFVEYTFLVPLNPDGSTTLNIEATWPFNGKYHDQNIGLLVATDTAVLPGSNKEPPAPFEAGFAEPEV